MRLDKRKALRQELDKTLDKTLDKSRFMAKVLKNKGLSRRDLFSECTQHTSSVFRVGFLAKWTYIPCGSIVRRARCAGCSRRSSWRAWPRPAYRTGGGLDRQAAPGPDWVEVQAKVPTRFHTQWNLLSC